MIRHYNYTERAKIPQKYVMLRTFNGESGFQEFQATLDLSNYRFPEGTSIFVEAYYRNSMMRFKMGTVTEEETLYTCQGVLTDLQDPQVNFRIKLVDESEYIGRLIGIADKIQTFNEDSRQVVRVGLLPVKFDDLDEQIWLLDIPDDGTGPVLCVNSTLETGNIPIAEILRSSPLFMTLVFPQIVRRILEHLLLSDAEDYGEEDPDHWANKWLRYAVTVLQIENPPSDEADRREWIDQAVSKFCTRNNIKEAFEKYILELQA